MKKYVLFLKWWLFITLITIGAVVLYRFGIFHEIWEKDSTKLSFLIISIFTFMSGWCGIKTWSLSKHGEDYLEEEATAKFERLEEIGWFTSDLCLTIGMIGTVCGFIMMLTGFTNLDVQNVKSVQALIGEMGFGMSTALYTTLVGLICSAFLKVQYFNLGQSIARHKNKSKSLF